MRKRRSYFGSSLEKAGSALTRSVAFGTWMAPCMAPQVTEARPMHPRS
jgi:hypothetical protein